MVDENDPNEPQAPKKNPWPEITVQRVVQILVLGVVAYAVVRAVLYGPDTQHIKAVDEADSAQLKQAFEQFRELGGLDASLLPGMRAVVQSETLREGGGVTARCGDTVRLGVRPIGSEDEARAKEPLPATETVSVALGSGSYNIALEQGIVGMQEGGIVRLFARPEISLRRDPLTGELKELGRAVVQAELFAVQKTEGEPEASYSSLPQGSTGAQCGETIYVGGRFYDGDWNLIGEWNWEDGMRAKFTLGENRWTGLERGLLGMVQGEKRLIVLTDRPAAGGIEAVVMPETRAIFAELTRKTPQEGDPGAPEPETPVSTLDETP